MDLDLYRDTGDIIEWGLFNFTFVRNEAQRGGAIFVDQKSSTMTGQERITAKIRYRVGFGLPGYEDPRCRASVKQFAFSSKVRYWRSPTRRLA